VSCPNAEKPVYPRQAIRQGISRGKVTARVTVDEKGNVLDVTIMSADPPRHFDRATIDALSAWKCSADGTRYQAVVEVNYSLTD
jgi:TonB family protein